MSDLEPPRCFLAAFSAKPCEGRLIRAHLIPKQRLLLDAVGRGFSEQEKRDIIWDPRCWVWACGGALGPSGHHGMLDVSRTLRIPRSALPEGLEEFAAEYGLVWWLDREYGPLCDLCGDSEVVYVNPGYPDPQTETDYPCPRCSRKAA